MAVATFIMRLSKSTQSSNCFKEAADRIGRVYLHPDFMKGEKLIVQITTSRANFSSGGYQTKMVPYKKTVNKVRFVEDVNETGELGDLYVSKKVLSYLGVGEEEAIEVKINMEEDSNAAAMA
ncbi:MAG: hypothetical protein FWD21_01450 [Peptococcaceae bacterium]|nr:hypothetical protein [Peptococcaceae bacterium]